MEIHRQALVPGTRYPSRKPQRPALGPLSPLSPLLRVLPALTPRLLSLACSTSPASRPGLPPPLFCSLPLEPYDTKI